MTARILFCAPSSGTGKTTVTCAVLRAMQRKGLKLAACKSGPDYIDPMFHQKVLETPGTNLDLFFFPPQTARALLRQVGEGADLTVLEGAMGFYDGIAMGEQASAYDLAVKTETPAVLVLDGRGSALSLAATIRGFAAFRRPNPLRGVILNRVKPAMAARLGEMLLKETGLRVRVITVPGGKDPDEFMRNYGKDGPARFKQLLEAGGNDVEYRLAGIRQKYDLETEDGKTRYLKEATEQVLCRLWDKMERDVYAGKLSQETGVGKESILDTAQRLSQRERNKERKQLVKSQSEVAEVKGTRNPEARSHMRAALAEEGVLCYLFLHQDRCEALERDLPPEKFVTGFNRRLYQILLGKTRQGEVTLGDLSEGLTQDELSEFARILAQRREAPPTQADVEEYGRILRSEGGFRDPKRIREASEEELKEYLETLRQRKQTGSRPDHGQQ